MVSCSTVLTIKSAGCGKVKGWKMCNVTVKNPKGELSLNFNQICDRIDFWASVPMLTSESYWTPYISLKKTFI